MTEDKLRRACDIQSRIEYIAKWLDLSQAVTYGPHTFQGVNLLSAQALSSIRTIAKEDVERQLSQLRQEFEAL
jgi:hypothetical protein